MPVISDLTLRQIPVVVPSEALDVVVALMQDEPLQTVALVGDSQFFGLYDHTAHSSGLVPPGADLSLLQVGPYIHPTRAIATPDMTIHDALGLMGRKSVTVLPVVKNHTTFLGIVTREDLADAAGRGV